MPDFRRLLLRGLAALAGLALTAPAGAAAFSEITDTERALTSVPGEPNAPAVVLFKKALFSMGDPIADDSVSFLTVKVRRKILSQEGKKYGEVAIQHSRWTKLREVKGRTVLPDGREIPLPDSAIFERTRSASEKTFVTTLAFPAVEVGAILDYMYEVRLPSIFWLEPWYFQEEVPTLYSEVLYDVPRRIGVSGWMRDPMRTGVRHETQKTREGGRIRAWGENLPAVPEEPFNLPFPDLASRFMLIPAKIYYTGETVELFTDWANTCRLYQEAYDRARKKSRAAQSRARSVSGGLSDRHEIARALYRFVRDEIETDPDYGIVLDERVTADSMLESKRASLTGKAVLLWSLLGGAGFEPRLVWVAERDSGSIDMQIANPWWFDRAIVALDLDGGRVFLDPSDRTLGFGRLSPDLEGTTALLVDRKSPETITLPVSRHEENQRQAKVSLGLDATGRLSGTGSLVLTGHHAWEEIQPRSQEEALKDWKEWLGEQYPGFDLGDVRLRESVDEQRVELTWAMAQREEEVLGDETSFAPSLPLGPVTQPFPLPMQQRLSPILFRFPDREESELVVTWPEGWRPEGLPQARQQEGEVGALTVSVTVDEAARTLTYRRRLDVRQSRIQERSQLVEIQKLFAETEKSDAQPLALGHR